MNRRLILNLLRREGALSRAALAARTRLSAPTVTGLVSNLMQEGLVLEGQTSPGALGRRPVPVSLNYAGRLVIGVKLMVNAIECVATDLSTTVLASAFQQLPDSRPETYVEAITEALPLLARRADRVGTPVMGIGISVPGVIDPDRGLCRRSHRLGWSNVPLAAMVAQKARVLVWLEDDTNAYAVAQHLFGAGRHFNNVAALAVGVGVGCAMIVDGKLYRGAHYRAGKFGHTIDDPEGPLCECGRRGCIQASYSEPAIVATWHQRAGHCDQQGKAEMLEAIKASDPIALSVLQEAGGAIGRHLATFVNIMDPDLIVMGGEAVSFGDALLGPMRLALARFTLDPPPPLMPEWDDSSWPRGAAALATQHLFDFEQEGTAHEEEPST